MGTSPLYTFESTFHHTPTQADVLGVTGLIFWTMTLIVLIKYVLIVLRADDSGEGGTFALYALLCRALGITPLGNQLGEADKSLARYSTSPAAVDQLARRNQSQKNSPYRCLSINTRPPRQCAKHEPAAAAAGRQQHPPANNARTQTAVLQDGAIDASLHAGP